MLIRTASRNIRRAAPGVPARFMRAVDIVILVLKANVKGQYKSAAAEQPPGGYCLGLTAALKFLLARELYVQRGTIR